MGESDESAYSIEPVKQHSSKAKWKKYRFSIVTVERNGRGSCDNVDDAHGRFVETKVLLSKTVDPNHYEHLAIKYRVPIYFQEKNVTDELIVQMVNKRPKVINYSAELHREVKRKVEASPQDFINDLEGKVKKILRWA